ncbi:hypothetical protein H5407_21930 [Mitsuaria sp. WAJ17]|uniref:hypothetical protein n=1 Tax=Mitsuaria sp. WAJ17 TaxID=2761452 RepID=UPI0015FFA395|nr:hypothetical protein [Mitsuaria sp. WAJ17]MBB2487903.1 hypothetical protein [Mitsuaria sp. WAJ17]
MSCDIYLRWEIVQKVSGWVFGRFFIDISGLSIGNINDDGVDLKGCLNWLDDFIANSQRCIDDDLFLMGSDELFRSIKDEIYGPDDSAKERAVAIKDAYGRFSFSHVGMSSFDGELVFVVGDSVGGCKILWWDDSVRTYETRMEEFIKVLAVGVAKMRAEFLTA